jgi:hypothetical protein
MQTKKIYKFPVSGGRLLYNSSIFSFILLLRSAVAVAVVGLNKEHEEEEENYVCM